MITFTRQVQRPTSQCQLDMAQQIQNNEQKCTAKCIDQLSVVIDLVGFHPTSPGYRNKVAMLGLIPITQYANWTWFTYTSSQQPAICTNICLCCQPTHMQVQGSYHTMPHPAPHTWHLPAHIYTHNTVSKTQF